MVGISSALLLPGMNDNLSRYPTGLPREAVKSTLREFFELTFHGIVMETQDGLFCVLSEHSVVNLSESCFLCCRQSSLTGSLYASKHLY